MRHEDEDKGKMCATGTKQNKYVDKFFDLLTNWFISICFYHATFVSRKIQAQGVYTTRKGLCSDS